MKKSNNGGRTQRCDSACLQETGKQIKARFAPPISLQQRTLLKGKSDKKQYAKGMYDSLSSLCMVTAGFLTF